MRPGTIAAVATAPGEGGIAIVRVSGDGARAIFESAFRPARAGAEIRSHCFVYGHVVGENGESIDEAMAVWMAAPRTYTREDVLELHCHGGHACASAVLARVLFCGARMADPGEFTRRAFENGRIDLSRAEAVMQLVGARGEAARRASLRQLNGGAAGFVGRLSRELTDLLSLVEAAADFPEEMEEDVVAAEICETASRLAAELEAQADARAARILREGASVVLSGRPNVGKSSLLNALIRSDRAIVTEVPGTTRDVLTERVELGGVCVEMSDTAGIREGGDAIESLGVERARRALLGADVVLLVLDGSRPLEHGDRALLAEADARYLFCINKADLPPVLHEEELPQVERVRVSAKTGEGLPALAEAIARRLGSVVSEPPLFTSQRQQELVSRAAAHLRLCRRALEDGLAVDVAADDLWRARRLLSEITGEDASEDVIDAIFRNFCVGK